MSLKESLSGLSPQDSDSALAKLWKDFKGTQYFEALLLALEDVKNAAAASCADPRSTPDVLRHSAGRLYAVDELLHFIKAALNFKLDDALYEPLSDTLGGEDNAAFESEEDPLLARKAP